MRVRVQLYGVKERKGEGDNATREYHGWSRRDLGLVRLLCYVLLQNARVGRLRVSEVEELVQQLVQDNEVVADALLLHLHKVLRQHL